jgi:cell division protein FtsI/penicillin-binding protein 2
MDFHEWQKRLGYIITVGGIILVSVVGRLYQKSFIEHNETVAAAESQYAYRKEVVGHRGEIVIRVNDTAYYPLASNERRYQVLVVPNHLKDAKDAAGKLAPILELNERDIFEKINNKKFYIPPLKHRLTREQADKIAGLKLRGVILLPEFVRIYPEQSLAAHILGFVNNEGKGNYGVEGTFDELLRGVSGFQVGEKDNQGRLISVDDEVKAKNGATIMLTINREIQRYVEQSLTEAIKRYEADSGSVIIVDPKTGAIVAMASLPTFNPNTFNTVASDGQSVFLNPNIASVWEPGSIVKPLVMALAIDKGLVQPETTETFGASVKVLNHEIFTAEKEAFGFQTMTQVLENSDNVGMVWVANKLGNQVEYEGLKKFGLGTLPDIRLSNAISGSLPAVKQWNDLTRATVSFGQGVSSTPLQMVMAYSAMANKGVLMQPHVIAEVLDEEGVLTKTEPKEVHRVVSEETSKKIGLMLESVVQNGHGKRAQVPGYRVGGKTGTAQVPKPGGGYYDDRHIGSFAGYFPISNPQYAMVVKLDNPKNVKFAESSAGPTFGEIAGWILRHQQVKPDKPQ